MQYVILYKFIVLVIKEGDRKLIKPKIKILNRKGNKVSRQQVLQNTTTSHHYTYLCVNKVHR